MLLYFDNCCLNRPYDDQTQLKIFLESLAKLSIQSAVLTGEHSLAWSYVLDYEIGKSPFRERAERFMQWKKLAVCFCNESEAILRNAEILRQRGLKIVDAMHTAYAISMKCDYLLTTDAGMFKKKLPKIAVLNPLEFVEKGFVIMTDTVLKYEGLKVLNDYLGPVGMERFLTLMSRDQGDYTEWHKAQMDASSVREYSKRAMDYQRTLN